MALIIDHDALCMHDAYQNGTAVFRKNEAKLKVGEQQALTKSVQYKVKSSFEAWVCAPIEKSISTTFDWVTFEFLFAYVFFRVAYFNHHKKSRSAMSMSAWMGKKYIPFILCKQNVSCWELNIQVNGIIIKATLDSFSMCSTMKETIFRESIEKMGIGNSRAHKTNE